MRVGAHTRDMTTNITRTETAEAISYARQLWDAANAEAECFHALDHHRTAEGDAFAQAVGGETIDEQAGLVAQCCTCTADDDENEEW